MTDWWTLWWVWGAAALTLGVAEVIVPGYIFLGFAIGAVVMAFIAFVAVLSLPLTLAVYAVLSLVGFLVLRKFFKMPNSQITIWDRDIND